MTIVEIINKKNIFSEYIKFQENFCFYFEASISRYLNERTNQPKNIFHYLQAKKTNCSIQINLRVLIEIL